MPKIPKSALVRKRKRRGERQKRGEDNENTPKHSGGRPPKNRQKGRSQEPGPSILGSVVEEPPNESPIPDYSDVNVDELEEPSPAEHDSASVWELPLTSQKLEVNTSTDTFSVQDKISPPAHRKECKEDLERAVESGTDALPMQNMIDDLPVQNIIDTNSEAPLLKFSQVGTHQAESPKINIIEMEDIATLSPKSPAFHLRQYKTSTPKVTVTVETASDGTSEEGPTKHREIRGRLSVPSSNIEDTQAMQELTFQCKPFRGSIQQEGIVLQEGQSINLEPDFDPETDGNPSFAIIGGRVIRLDNEDDALKHATSLSVNACTEVPVEEFAKTLESRLHSRLPRGWKLTVERDRVYVLNRVPNDIKFIVRRAVSVACDGSDWKVQVHLETLPEGHPIYSNEILLPLVPLTRETIEQFSTVLLRAVSAVYLHRVCIGVDLPQCVDEWLKHPDCTLDRNQFEESGYEKTLRNKDCSYLVTRHAKRCAACNRYFDAMIARSQRRSQRKSL